MGRGGQVGGWRRGAASGEYEGTGRLGVPTPSARELHARALAKQTAIAAVAQPDGVRDQSHGATAEVMGLPGRAHGYARWSEQARRQLPVAGTGVASVEGAKSLHEPMPALPGHVVRGQISVMQRVPEAQHRSETLRKVFVERDQRPKRRSVGRAGDHPSRHGKLADGAMQPVTRRAWRAHPRQGSR